MASIRKRTLPSGKICWLVDFKDQNGKRRARQFGTKREADAFSVKARSQIVSGIFVHDVDSVSISEACRQWLDACASRFESGQRMERATYQDYEAKVRLHILDHEIGLGAVKLSQLSRQAVVEFRDRLLKSGRSEATTRKVLSSLSLVIKHAQERGLVAGNPVRGVRVLRTSRTDIKVQVPSKESVRELLAAAPEHFKPLIAIAALCGLRASETRALQWTDVDFSEGLIHVRRRADAFNNIGEPKSKAGLRAVPMGPYVSTLLKRWRLACPNGSMDLIFPNKWGRVRAHTTVLKRHFKPLCRQVGVDLRWHDLRHFAVSLWIEQGFNVKEVMTFAGHSSVQMTMDRYGHLFRSPDHQRGMAEIENRLLG